MADVFKRNKPIEKMTENLKIMRNKLGLTQEGLAGKIGISRQTFVNIEKQEA